MDSKGVRIALAGDIRSIKAGRNPNDLVLALLFIWPKGKTPYSEVDPVPTIAGPAERSQFWDKNPRLFKKWLSDKERVNQENLKELLSVLRSSTYCKEIGEVRFDNLWLHVGHLVKFRDFHNTERLLVAGQQEDRTLISYLDGGPSSLHCVRAHYKGRQELLSIKDELNDRNVATFFEAARSPEAESDDGDH